MGSELVPFANVQDRLREKVSAAMLDLIPPAAFDEFVTTAWKTFTEEHVVHGTGYNAKSETKPPELLEMIEKEMRKHVETRVKEWCEEYAKEWAKGEAGGEHAKQLLRECTKIASEQYMQTLTATITANAVTLAMSRIPTACCSCGVMTTKGDSCKGCGTYNS